MDDDLLQPLIDDGSILSADGETVQFDWPVFKALHPEAAQAIWIEHLTEVDQALFALAEKGLVELEVVETDDEFGFELQAELTDLGRTYVEATRDDV